MRKYAIIAAVMGIELLLGFQYAWAVFDRALQEGYGFSASQAQSVFAAQIVMFAVTFPAAGWVLHRFGPRVTTLAGGVIYGAALVLGGEYGSDPRALFWTTGVLFGSGLALAYISPIVTTVKWFPRYKGVATGIVVACYGSSSFFTAAIAQKLLGHGMTPFAILTIFGVTAGCGVVLLSLVLVNPPGADDAAPRSRFPKGVLSTGRFWALAAAYFAGATAGQAVLPSLARIGRTLGAPEAWLALGVMAIAAGNTSGRIAWGVISELIGTRLAVCATLLLEGGCILALAFFGAGPAAYIALAFLIGVGYGGNFVLYITDVSRTYGADRVGSVWGLIGLAYIATGFLGAPSAGYSYDHWGTYVPSMCAAAALTVVGMLAFLALYGHPVKEHAEAAPPEPAAEIAEA